MTLASIIDCHNHNHYQPGEESIVTKMSTKFPSIPTNGKKKRNPPMVNECQLFPCCSSSQHYFSHPQLSLPPPPTSTFFSESQQVFPSPSRNQKSMHKIPTTHRSVRLSSKQSSSFLTFVLYVKKLFSIFRFRAHRKHTNKFIRQRIYRFRTNPLAASFVYNGYVGSKGNLFYPNIMATMSASKQRRLERFFEQHRIIMKTLAKRKFGVSRMFAEQRKRLKYPAQMKDSQSYMMKPRYRILNNLYNTMFRGNRNRMNGYRYFGYSTLSNKNSGNYPYRDRCSCCVNCCNGRLPSSFINSCKSISPSRLSKTPSSDCIDCLISGLIQCHGKRNSKEICNSELVVSNKGKPAISTIVHPLRGVCCNEDFIAPQPQCNIQRRERKMMQCKQLEELNDKMEEQRLVYHDNQVDNSCCCSCFNAYFDADDAINCQESCAKYHPSSLTDNQMLICKKNKKPKRKSKFDYLYNNNNNNNCNCMHSKNTTCNDNFYCLCSNCASRNNLIVANL